MCPAAVDGSFACHIFDVVVSLFKSIVRPRGGKKSLDENERLSMGKKLRQRWAGRGRGEEELLERGFMERQEKCCCWAKKSILNQWKTAFSHRNYF